MDFGGFFCGIMRDVYFKWYWYWWVVILVLVIVDCYRVVCEEFREWGVEREREIVLGSRACLVQSKMDTNVV
jgi:hypothetical protein